ncbi:helix-turn-helix domain-containing protein [Conexibacter sp. W3-3-2]|uniref:helix-turn-helix domain-containing protein n=1 Tax=Conexibacter sp. W3-3-2 TaxID=2675227 RepID=UPI0012B73AE8|nr:helix-turn-helix domain-containing protein [Conexibacter sp. W3-3-2]MTD43649.1 helix-turn-helix domain-containing protein [Conexibacter sp. W3-3-2]
MDGQLDFDGELRRSRDTLLVADEVAAMLRVTTSLVYAETRAGRIPCVRLGRYYRYRASAIAAWIEEVEQR